MAHIYGIGNPLIDISIAVEDHDLTTLGLHKGTMRLIDTAGREELLTFFKNHPTSYSCGGSCPNTMITLASLSVPATIAGKVGSDEYGGIYRSRISAFGAGDELRTGTDPTGSSIILITPDSERTMNTYLGANRQFSSEDINEETLITADYFHFTGYMWDTETQKEAIKKAVTLAKKQHTKVSFDLADPFAVGRYREAFLDLIKNHCDIVFANSEEARILFDNYDAYECCRTMGKLCETVVVKNGKRGSYVCHKGNVLTIPVRGPFPPVDTTGAGDTYAAGFLYGLFNHMSVEDAGNIASFLAGEIIMQQGAQFSSEKAVMLSTMLQNGSWKA